MKPGRKEGRKIALYVIKEKEGQGHDAGRSAGQTWMRR